MYVYIYIDDSLVVSLETWVVIVELEYLRRYTRYDMCYIVYTDDVISELVYTYILWRLRRSWVSYYMLRDVLYGSGFGVEYFFFGLSWQWDEYTG